MKSIEVLPVIGDGSGATCRGHMMSGKKAQFTVMITAEPATHLCAACLRDLAQQIAAVAP